LKVILSRTLVVGLLSAVALAQTADPTAKPAATPAKTTAAKTPSKQLSKEETRKKFVLDVVHSAVALPQSDPQDRLRVLSAAASVVGPIDPKLAQQYAKEGAAIETKLVAEGQMPNLTMLSGGNVDCATAATFVQTIPPSGVIDAQQALVGAIVNCPKQVTSAAAAKLEAGIAQGVVAGRPLLALMNSEGMDSQWTRDIFTRMFSSLPDDASLAKEAPNYASMYMQVAGQVASDTAKTAGKSFLYWLAKLPESPERSVATNLTSSALQQAIGTDAYQELLRSDASLQQLVSGSDPGATLPVPEEDNVNVQEAGDKGDRTGELRSMPASQRARNAAATGFITGTQGDRKQAENYFDVAFAALDEVWSSRRDGKVNAAEVVQEVSEAAAQVDAVEALQRAQKLQDPSAQAIGMLAVARVINGQQ
jgi:hypothetical protein